MEKFGVKAREVYDGLSGVWSILSKGEFRGSSLTFGLEEDSPAVATLFKVREGLQAIKGLFSGDDAGDIGAMFEKLSKTGGDAEVAIDGLTGAADENKSVLGQLWDVTKQVGDAVKSAGVSIVELGGDSVTVAASGLRVVGTRWVSWQITRRSHRARLSVSARRNPGSGELDSQRQLTAALNENSAAMRANIAAMGGVPPAAAQSTAARIRDAAATRAQSAAARIGAATTVTSSQALVRFATAQRVAATSNGVFVGGMRQATASAAMFGARVQSAGTAALGGMRTAAGGLAGFLTGPWGIAIAAAAAGFLLFSGSGQDAEQRAQEIQGAVSDLATTLHESGGAYTAAGQNAAAA
uniref:Uncharacterized protein n=1 Tax=Caenorhabditis japonica TaxID=281687 RepID=A0A8R1EJQ4_CAEJA